ncbi:MAG: SHOCT domain-containing protein [Deltaproteobacteria bacterium]|nr:SHOCT domain-containing protein [Candidatus Zymogenaceae bacterium]
MAHEERDFASQMQELKDLLEQGVLTPEEFESGKKMLEHREKRRRRKGIQSGPATEKNGVPLFPRSGGCLSLMIVGSIVTAALGAFWLL